MVSHGVFRFHQLQACTLRMLVTRHELQLSVAAMGMSMGSAGAGDAKLMVARVWAATRRARKRMVIFWILCR